MRIDIVGNKVASLRKKNKLTQKQIADFLNVDQSYISKCESNERSFTLEILEKISNLFGCPLEYFTNLESKYEPMPFALRAKNIQNEDLEAISKINKLALNMKFMEKIIQEEK
ncbi:helix-turn-helix domain-containing protein [Clostridium perfringens]|uniref:helix-turn-helix domain-containing protein n=1 Tax=Clostridium perfringens TaxID=1502 RepID=UPI001A327A95|nr:helix-turn-helix transcriptional regulator [Clostridium perfringens]MDM0749464.1 helix-turn-helix transcriptional regulator [Clostridium perfringens]HAT4272735.1 helix-turn-helix transcriptional regulator [Clostridium perfringens]